MEVTWPLPKKLVHLYDATIIILSSWEFAFQKEYLDHPRGAALHRRLKTFCDSRLTYAELTIDKACQLPSDLKFEPTEVHVAEIRRRFFLCLAELFES